jgi:hypothetical protein
MIGAETLRRSPDPFFGELLRVHISVSNKESVLGAAQVYL